MYFLFTEDRILIQEINDALNSLSFGWISTTERKIMALYGEMNDGIKANFKESNLKQVSTFQQLKSPITSVNDIDADAKTSKHQFVYAIYTLEDRLHKDTRLKPLKWRAISYYLWRWMHRHKQREECKIQALQMNWRF